LTGNVRLYSGRVGSERMKCLSNVVRIKQRVLKTRNASKVCGNTGCQQLQSRAVFILASFFAGKQHNMVVFVLINAH